MRPGPRRRLRLFVGIVLAGVLTGAIHGALIGAVASWGERVGAAMGAIDGFAIALPITGVELFLPRTRVGRRLEQGPFLLVFAAKWLVYGGVILAVIAADLGARVVVGHPPFGPFGGPFTSLTVVFAFAASFTFISVLQIGRLVGLRTLRDVVLGRYRRPRVEERFFLFVDMIGSTPLAERLGAAAIHRFLARVFRLAAAPIEDHGGEVYQYVGDEMVVTWSVAAGRTQARPIAAFFAIEETLRTEAARFERDFGAVPELRAALHAGPVIVGEVGESRRQIVFHGDVINTAARLEQASRDLGRRFLVSADALARMDGVDRYALDDLGAQRVRGRARPVHMYAVDLAKG